MVVIEQCLRGERAPVQRFCAKVTDMLRIRNVELNGVEAENSFQIEDYQSSSEVRRLRAKVTDMLRKMLS